MGSGNSRLNGSEGEAAVPMKIRSTLIGRFEEFKKRRNGQGNLSKKQLLKDSAEEGVSPSHSSHENETKENKNNNNNNNNKVIIMKKEIQVQPIIEETVVQVTRTTTITTIEKLSRVVPISISQCEIKEEKEKESIKDNIEHVKKDIETKVVDDDDADADEKVNETEIKTQEGNVVDQVEEIVKPEKNEEEVSAKSDDNDNDNDNDNDSDGDDDEEEENEEYGRLLCPGSPSFRIYFIEAEKRKEEEEEEEEEKCEYSKKNESSTIVVHQKSRSAGSVASIASRHSRRISNEVHGVVEMETRTKRKGKGMKKFGPVRTLMKVKSCYYPMCTCTGDERNRVVAAKAVN